MLDLWRRFRQSLFTKLATIMVLGVIGINVVTISLYRQQRQRNDTTLNRSLVQYAHALADEVGTPPDKEIATRIARERLMRVTLSGPTSWAVGEIDRYFPGEHLLKLSSEGGVTVYNLHGNYRLVVQIAPKSTLTFDLYPSETERASMKKYVFMSLIGSILVMLVVYLAIRFLLRPIGWLTRGAEAVRDGSLDTRVAEKGRGELRELTETFNEMAERLESLVSNQRDLLLGVSHELRTPLTRLKLRLEMVDESVKTDPMRKDIRQMEAMITSILETARLSSETGGIHCQEIDLRDLAAEVAESFQSSHPGVTAALPATQVRIKADPDRLRMAMSILLDNGIKYSTPDSAPVELTLTDSRQGVTITVADHGVGIPEPALPHLFEPFYRVDESRARDTGGYGLGLHLCRAIIKAHDGRIEVESSVGVGTTFRFFIPTGE